MKNISTIFLLGLIATVGVFTLDVYLPGMPSMAEQFDVSITQIGYTFTIFSVVFAICQLFHGTLSDFTGRKPILIGGLIVAAIATLLCINANSYGSLLSARILQATGISAFVVVNAIIRDLYTGTKAIQVRTFVTTVSGVSLSIAPTIGGMLQSRFDWQGGFFISLLLILATLIYAALFFSESNANRSKFSLNVTLIGKSYLALFSNHSYVLHIMLATLAYTVHFSFIIMSANIFINLLGFTPLIFGYLMILYGGVYFISGISVNYIANKLPHSTLITLGATCIGAGGVLMLILLFLLPLSAWQVLLPMSLMTMGVTVVRAAAATGALAPIPAQAGQGAAGLNLVQFMVSAVIATFVSALGSEPQLSLATLAIISSGSIIYLLKGI